MCGISSVYMPHDEKPPPKKVIELVEYIKAENIPLILSCNANAHLTLCEAPAQIDRERPCLVNRGSSPTSIRRGGREVLDTAISSYHERLVNNWHLSDLLSFSDHRIIQSKIDVSQRQRKLLGDTRKTIWHTYNHFLAKKLANLPAIPRITEEDLDQVAKRLTESMNSAFKQTTPPKLVEEGTKPITG